jgi:phosphoribosylanthranilate isomerase
MVKIKICGITNIEDAMAAAEFGVDALGFVFAASPRRITPKDASKIISHLPAFMTTVGVFVDEDGGRVNEIVRLCRLDAVQFHGREAPSYCAGFRRIAKVIKAFKVRDEDSIKAISNYEVDACLLDAYSAYKAGGTGECFNWELAIDAKKFGKQVILAGGLTPANIAAAIKKVEPYAVDVSSGVESLQGTKDHNLMKLFIQKVRGAGL